MEEEKTAMGRSTEEEREKEQEEQGKKNDRRVLTGTRTKFGFGDTHIGRVERKGRDGEQDSVIE